MYGIIGLTLRILLPIFNPLDDLDEIQQVRHLKGSATCGQDDTGIRRH
jgi:hypothetical protein